MIEGLFKTKAKELLGKNSKEIIAAIDAYRRDRRQHAIYQAVMARMEPSGPMAHVDIAVDVWFKVEEALKAKEASHGTDANG